MIYRIAIMTLAVAQISGCSESIYEPVKYASNAFSDNHTVYSVQAVSDNSIGCVIGYGWADLNYRSRDSHLAKIIILDASGNTIDEEFGVLPSISRGKNGVNTVTAVNISCASIGGFQLKA